VLLGSDGLFDNLYPAQITDTCRDRQLPRVAQRLAHDALAQMLQPAAGFPSKPDDLTFIAFRLT
jgi:serine/threonine protein phosphatase PrpC